MSIEVNHLSYTYDRGTAQAVSALRDISFRIDDGEYVGIMGHTGCGKSTLIQLIAGLIPPSSGQILFDGTDIWDRKYDRTHLRSSVGIVFQQPEFQLFETTVEKDVAFSLKHSGLERKAVCARVRHALELMGFDYDTVQSESPLALSGGEKRRIAIAGVLAAEPRVLIFDEPIAGLDPRRREEFLALTDRLHREGVTILIVSHNADALAEHAGRILVLDSGKLIADASPAEIAATLPGCEGEIHRIARILRERDLLPEASIVSREVLADAIADALKGGM
ncbi:MAG: energy-coupling factor transporter ATPase [Ruminococcaceae bacterium]|nr:energy-coupling factor transporter ATPase [Oscillospiraceae bacterium]